MTFKRTLHNSLIITALLLTALSASATAPYLSKNAPTFSHTLSEFEQSYNTAYPEFELPPYREIKAQAQSGSIFLASKINNVLYSSAVLDARSKKIKSLQITYIPLKVASVETSANVQRATIIKKNERLSATDSGPVKPEPAIKAQMRIKTPTNEITLIDGSAIIIGDSDAVAADYMATLYRWFNPALSKKQCEEEVARLIKLGKDQPLYQETINNLRYVVVDRGEKGVTLAVEPIKQPKPVR